MFMRLNSVMLVLVLSVTLLSAQIKTGEFALRRSTLTQNLGNGVIILRGEHSTQRNGDVDFKFRQGSDFYYLSGFDEADATLLIVPGEKKKFILFVKENNPRMAIWLGETYGIQGAIKIFKADTAFASDKFEEEVKKYLYGKEKVYVPFADAELFERVSEIITSPRGRFPKKIEDVTPHIAELRLTKSDYEIEMMQKSIDITVAAHKEAMMATKPGLFEYEIGALIEYVYQKNGSPRVGFPSIVGSGANSTILHYEANDHKMKNGDVVVMDIGAEYGMYSADVTRTIPVSGKFSTAQSEIYQIVLDAQKAGIDLAKPGIGFSEVHKESSRVITEGLYKLGLITDKDNNWQTRVWFMHGTSHWLGLDVHDAGNYRGGDKRGRLLEPGMVLTVEPGIYVAPNALENLKLLMRGRLSNKEMDDFIAAVKPAFEKYKNIGVRIEDDILITKNGHRNLSASAPREIDAIEKLMAKPSDIVK